MKHIDIKFKGKEFAETKGFKDVSDFIVFCKRNEDRIEEINYVNLEIYRMFREEVMLTHFDYMSLWNEVE